MHAVLSYRGNRPTNKHTHTHTHKPTDRTDYNTLRRSFASAQNNKLMFALEKYFKAAAPSGPGTPGSPGVRGRCIAESAETVAAPLLVYMYT